MKRSLLLIGAVAALFAACGRAELEDLGWDVGAEDSGLGATAGVAGRGGSVARGGSGGTAARGGTGARGGAGGTGGLGFGGVGGRGGTGGFGAFGGFGGCSGRMGLGGGGPLCRGAGSLCVAAADCCSFLCTIPVGACTGICTIGSGGTGGFAGAGGSFGGRGGTGGTGGSFGGSGGTGGAPSCGNGIVESGEQCDLGASNQDRPALRIGQGGWTMAVTPVDRVVSAQQFYSYSSASSHTGFEVAGYSRILLYRDRTTGLLSLITFHGVDFDSTGQSQPPTAFSQTFDGLPLTSVVVLSDDPGELLKLSTTSARGQWQFVRNSDGGIIGGLPLPGSWSISVNVTLNSGGIRSWEYLDGGGTLATLDLGTTLVIEAFDSPARCRKSRWPGDRLGCTIPFCGDAILDGGEVCDDGNRIGGDGCSADCKSLN